MFLSHEIVKSAYEGLIKLDSSEGKSRKEKVSGLRYLFATSELLQNQTLESVDLTVGSLLRPLFITAVANVVSLNDGGLYTKDFANELDTKGDYGIGSNFTTTRLANSRSQNILYPGRPAPLLLLEKEHVTIVENVGEVLSKFYGVNKVKPELCIWLLRNEDFDHKATTITSSELHKVIEAKLSTKYTANIVHAILPSEVELQDFISKVSNIAFVVDKPDHSDIPSVTPEPEPSAVLLHARVLSNDLADDDKVFVSVEQLLERGAKGIIFSGPPGTSKTWYALKVAIKIIDGNEDKMERVQFHPSFSYEDFIEGLVSTGSAMGTEPLFKPKSKVFLNLCEKAEKDLDSLYILIIDEFSRGDPSKIFGELLTYIEPDYRNIKFRLPYSEREVSIPQNVIIFATMNPYDKSVVDLDSAMERRFNVVELLPSVTVLNMLLASSGLEGEVIGNVVTFFNIANRLSPHGFGHTYFKGIKDEIDFILLWNHKLKFIFEKMFRFKEDAFKEIKDSYVNIISEPNRSKIE
ncbi:MAG: AAA family ATPase [Methylotenera sp.]|nr:AAA family ATPase [Methylotenera sp.]